MSYEVIKAIGGGRYRYNVQSYRDPESGKTRTRWQYLGKAEGAQPQPRRRRAGETRARLISALERRLASVDWTNITARDVAVEAGVAPATFYRYFTSREELLRACAERAIGELDARFTELLDVAGDVASERARLRQWTMTTVNDTTGSAVLIAVWSSALAKAELAHERNQRRRSAFEEYLSRLKTCGYIALEAHAARELAIALALIVQAFSYRVVLGRVELLAEECNALAEAVERLIFAA